MIPFETRLKNFIDSISFAADENVQSAMWIHPSPNPPTSIISIDEFYCQFFDDNGMDDFIANEINDSPLSGAQKVAIVEFRDLLNAVEGVAPHKNCDSETVVQSKEWKAIVACASRILPLFIDFRQSPTNNSAI